MGTVLSCVCVKDFTSFSDFIFLKGNIVWDQGEDVFLSGVTVRVLDLPLSWC